LSKIFQEKKHANKTHGNTFLIKKNCSLKNPPGIEIYHQTYSTIDNPLSKDRIANSVSVYEIVGEEQKLYCQNLCLIAKLFLDHKSIYFDVSPFKFYILTENDNNGKHIVAYFSKEISMETEFNLACIMVLPPYQRKGYGQFLISMSYYFSRLEGRICTPETPLSDLGKISYKSYWTNTILEVLLKNKGFLSIKELCEQTGIKTEDIIFTLNELSLVIIQ
jgi:histone acetyltransferase MYST1